MAPEQRGTITAWKDERGFGFITPADGQPPIFFHIRDVRTRQTRPVLQTAVRFTRAYDAQQRPHAINVSYEDLKPEQDPFSAMGLTLGAISCFFVLLLGMVAWLGLSPWVVAWYGGSSVLTYGLYARDKTRAMRGHRRIPEQTLHLWEVVGGWPGAALAQEVYHHKTVKRSYQYTFWLMVMLNLLGLIGFSALRILSQRTVP